MSLDERVFAVIDDAAVRIGSVAWAAVHWSNLLREPPVAFDWPGDRLLTFSGTLADDLFERDHATWLRPGHEAFEAMWDALAPQLQRAGSRVCIVPHARHVLSDVQSSAHFHRERLGQPLEIALAPAALLEPGMLDDIEVHLTRMFETLGPIAAFVILEDVSRDQDRHGLPVRVPMGTGALPRDLLLDLVERCVPIATPLVLPAARSDAARRWLEGRSA